MSVHLFSTVIGLHQNERGWVIPGKEEISVPNRLCHASFYGYCQSAIQTEYLLTFCSSLEVWNLQWFLLAHNKRMQWPRARRCWISLDGTELISLFFAWDWYVGKTITDFYKKNYVHTAHPRLIWLGLNYCCRTNSISAMKMRLADERMLGVLSCICRNDSLLALWR